MSHGNIRTPTLMLALALAAWPMAVRAQASRSGGAVTQPSTVGSLGYDTPPLLTHRVPPKYEGFPLEAGIMGKVILRALVDTTGHVSQVKVLRGVTGLTPAALECVRQWTFEPARRGKRPVEAWYDTSISLPIDACPPAVLTGARAAIVVQVGDGFFARYLSLDSSACGFLMGVHTEAGSRPAHWAMAYKLQMPGKPWVKGRVRVDVDPAGSLLAGHSVEGIADCAHHPERCRFSVDKRRALEIAAKSGLAQGLGPWEAGFQWITVPRATYAWRVQNTLRAGVTEEPGGETAIIDASSGEFLGMLPWGNPGTRKRPRARGDSTELPAEGAVVYYEEAPVPIQQPQPEWPQIISEKPIEGTVVLHVLVGKDGAVRDVRVIKGVQGMDEAVKEVVRRWVYRPALSNNKPVAVWIVVPYHFRLN